jgi:predicted PurR-regulated permease PerM
MCGCDGNMKTDQENQINENIIEVNLRKSNLRTIKQCFLLISFFAVIFFLDYAQPFLISMLLGTLIALTLNPVINWLETFKINRLVGSTFIITLLVFMVGLGSIGLSGQVESIINQLPDASKKISSVFKEQNSSLSNIRKVQIAASEVQRITNDEQLPTKTIKAMQVIIKQEPFKLSDYYWRGSMGIVGIIGEFLTVIFLAYFLLISGEMFKRKLVKLTGPTISNKKITVHLLHDINNAIQQYMFMLLITNSLVGLFMFIALKAIGLENAGAWSVAAGLVHFVPYFGPIVTAIAIGIATFMQFNSITTAFIAIFATLVIATIVGVFITTWMTGRIAKMNSAAVFISLIFFTWIWGIWGMLLGIPLIVIIKVIAAHIENFQAISELLGK